MLDEPKERQRLFHSSRRDNSDWTASTNVLLTFIIFALTDADKAVQHVTPFSFPWPLGSQFSMMGLSELKAAISLENDGVASSERQRIMKWTTDDVMSHVRTLGCTEQAKVFGEQVGVM